MRCACSRRGAASILANSRCLPFGGAGAVHAAAVAEELGMRRIIVPPRPGAFSALGLLCTDVLHDYIRSELGPLDRLDPAHAETIFRELRRRRRASLPKKASIRAPPPSSAISTCAMPGRAMNCACRWAASGGTRSMPRRSTRRATRFDDVHERIHGHAAKEKSVEVVSYRLRVRVSVPKFSPQAQPAQRLPRRLAEAVKGTRAVFFAAEQPTETTIYDRERLAVGASFAGPAIVEQFDATSVVPPGGWHAIWIDRLRGNLYPGTERPGQPVTT